MANDYVKQIEEIIPEQRTSQGDESKLPVDDAWDFSQRCFEIVKLISKDKRRKVCEIARELLYIPNAAS
jgi:hypothetical protein